MFADVDGTTLEVFLLSGQVTVNITPAFSITHPHYLTPTRLTPPLHM